MLDEKSSNTASVVVLCTAPDEATAQDLAAKVLAEKLAACATLIPGATSLYYWEGKLEQEYEVQMIFKNYRISPAGTAGMPEVSSSISNPGTSGFTCYTRRHRLPLMAQRIFTLILLLCSTSVFAGLFDAPGRSQFVPADQAFAFDFQQNQHDLNLTWQIKDGYYLYRKQIRITPEHAKIADVQLPQGVWHEDEFYGKSEIYRDRLTLPVTINKASAGATLTVTYQGCADAGFCYPPETKTVPLSEVVANNAASQPVSVPQQEQPTAQLPFSALWALLIGIGIAFTPCVLPMYPLISGIVLGGKQRLSTARALLLTFIYVQGMALTYTALGLVVAAAGLQFQAALQHPYVLIGLAIVFTLLAMSMFGLFTLQLPSSLQTRLTLMSNRQQGGSPGGVFVMGAIAGLICSPCTTAPLSAILLYIAQSGNMWLGAARFISMRWAWACR